MKLNPPRLLAGISLSLACLVTLCCKTALAGDGELLVANEQGGTVGAYDATTGGIYNASLVTGVGGAHALAVSGNDLLVSVWAGQPNTIQQFNLTTGASENTAFIAGMQSYQVGGMLATGGNLYYTTSSLASNPPRPTSVQEYTTAGVAVASPFITLPSGSLPYGVAEANNILYVALGYSYQTAGQGVIAEYNATTGAVINASFITGLNIPEQIWLSGNNLYIANNAGFISASFPFTNGTIGEYDATTGAAINANLVTGLDQPAGVAVLGNTLYVSSTPDVQNGGIVGTYNATTGATINANFVTGLADPQGLFVIATPEPSTLAMLAIGSLGLFVLARRRRT